MTTHPHKIDQHNIDPAPQLDREGGPHRPALPQASTISALSKASKCLKETVFLKAPSQTVFSKDASKTESWHLVTSDGATNALNKERQVVGDKEKKPLRRPPAADRTPEESYIDALLNPPEAGVDLSRLDVDMEKDALSKMIAGLQSLGTNEPAQGNRRAIGMPQAATDLEKLLRTDAVCMVHRPQAEAEPASASPSASPSSSTPTTSETPTAGFKEISLNQLTEVWPKLPTATRMAISSLVENAGRMKSHPVG